MIKNITDSVIYVGVDDKTLDLFESQYIIPNGISYNSYVIMDEKIAIMDTVDKRGTEEWIANLDETLNGKLPDYLVVLHMEPDHAGNIQYLCEKYPQMQVVMNKKTESMIPQFFDIDLKDRSVIVSEGDKLSLGRHELIFVMAPMIHWPEVMVAYDSAEKILFSADAFGKFGALDADEDWTCEARRYYINIVGKYGVQVQGLLKKASALDIQTICPLHGPILTENLGYYIDKYNVWSSYEAEDDGVLIAYASIHGNTAKAAKIFEDILKQKGAKKVAMADLSRDDIAEAVEDAFRYDKLIVACPTYDGCLFPCMEDFLYHLKIKTYRNRKVGIIENGSWAPASGKLMRAYFEQMKDITLCENIVTIKSTLKEDDVSKLEILAEEILSK